MQEVWTELDRYFGGQLITHDPVLEGVLETNRREKLVAQDVSRLQGKFLDLLVRISGTRRILEIGTLGGYSTIWFARAIPPDGRIVTLEMDPRHAAVAAGNLSRAGIDHKVDLRIGIALDLMAGLAAEAVEPFDLIFFDADKRNNPGYLEFALQLSHPGTIFLADNIVRTGKVAEADSEDADVRGVRHFIELVGAHPRLSATALQTVGAKGYDGFMLAIVTE